MVFVKDFRREFYDVVQHERVLVLVASDVDALCSCKILQYLFRCDHVLYTVVPVAGSQDLEKAYIENAQGVKFVLLLNCGGSMDIVETVQPEPNVIFFICDSHRPIDVHNIYNQVQVKLLMREEEFTDVPEFEAMFREESDEEDSGNESDDPENPGKRRKFDEAAIERRIERRKWTERRQQLIYAYEEFAFYGTSSALLLYEMAWRMTKDTNDLLWWAIIGVTEQYLHEKVDRDHYIDSVGRLQSHVSRLNVRGEEEEKLVSVDCLKLGFEQELQLILYRHWSLFESLCHSPLTSCNFRVWTMKGKKKLHEFLADMGLPLVQSRQRFASMDVCFKDDIKDMLKNHAEKYNISEEQLLVPSFKAQYGYKNRYCAADMVYSCESLLEAPEKDKSHSDTFLEAQDVLSRANTESLEKAVESAKTQLKAIVAQVQTFLDMHQIISAGSFLYGFVKEGSPDVRLFSKPIGLSRLARFTLRAYCATSRNKKAKTLPLVLGTPGDSERGTMLVIGIPPANDNTCRNCFGKAFESAASHTNSRILPDYFDTHIIELKNEDKSKFFDALISTMEG